MPNLLVSRMHIAICIFYELYMSNIIAVQAKVCILVYSYRLVQSNEHVILYFFFKIPPIYRPVQFIECFHIIYPTRLMTLFMLISRQIPIYLYFPKKGKSDHSNPNLVTRPFIFIDTLSFFFLIGNIIWCGNSKS